MVLAQAEYRLGTREIPEEMYLWILEHFNIILFVDVGWVGSVDTEASLFDGFDGLSWSSLKSDVGIALANRSGSVRFQVARRTDTGKKPFIFSFRISRPF